MRFDSARAVARTLTAPVVLTIALAIAPAHSARGQKTSAVVDTLVKGAQKKSRTAAQRAALSRAPKITVRKDGKGMKGFAGNLDCATVLDAANSTSDLGGLPQTQAVSWLRCAVARQGGEMVAATTATVGTGPKDVETFGVTLPAGEYFFAIVGDASATETGLGFEGPGTTDDDTYGADGHILIKKMTLPGGTYHLSVVFNGEDETVATAIMIFRMGGDEE